MVHGDAHAADRRGQVAEPDAASAGVVTQAFGTALLLLPMTLALGATFPLALVPARVRRSADQADDAIGAATPRASTPPTRSARSPARSIAGFVLVPRSACA